MHWNPSLKAGITACLLLWLQPACAAESGPPPAVDTLIQKDLLGAPDKEILMITVEYVPGGASLPHRHDAQVFVYVLEGALTMQIEGTPPRVIRKGETFYESPTDVHQTSANASATAPAKILVFIVKAKGAPVSRPVPLRTAP